jgi:hypothetical protein
MSSLHAYRFKGPAGEEKITLDYAPHQAVRSSIQHDQTHFTCAAEWWQSAWRGFIFCCCVISRGKSYDFGVHARELGIQKRRFSPTVMSCNPLVHPCIMLSVWKVHGSSPSVLSNGLPSAALQPVSIFPNKHSKTKIRLSGMRVAITLSHKRTPKTYADLYGCLRGQLWYFPQIGTLTVIT